MTRRVGRSPEPVVSGAVIMAVTGSHQKMSAAMLFAPSIGGICRSLAGCQCPVPVV